MTLLGARLLAACGYKGEGGLGAREDGAVEPVEARVKRDRAGIGSAAAKAYKVVGAKDDDDDDDAQRRTRRATTSDAGEDADDDADDATRRMKKIKTKRASERAVREQRRGNAIARGLYRAFKEEEKAGDVNPLSRFDAGDVGNGGGMSASNPLRRLAR